MNNDANHLPALVHYATDVAARTEIPTTATHMDLNYPTNTDDVIDSRDVIEALQELEPIVFHDAEPTTTEVTMDFLRTTWNALVKLAEQGADYSEDWQYGATLIRDSYFKDYAQELADDIGYRDALADRDNVPWPFTCIDWAQAARELQQDYTSVDFDGVTYWVR